MTLALFCALWPAPVRAQSKDDLLKQAQAAEQKGDIEGASNAYCELAKQDTATYAPRCRTYSNLVSKERENDAGRIKDGKAALASGDFDTAKQKFSAVKLAENKATAADYLNNKIPAAEKAAQAAQAAAQQQQQQQAQQAIAGKISQARDLFNSKNYEGAKAALAGVNTPEAQQLLTQITQAENSANQASQTQQLYNQKVSEGDSLMAQGKYNDAENAYRAAAGIRGSTPGDLQAKITQAEERARSAQNGSVSGQLLDEGGNAVSGAVIMLDGPTRGRTTTDRSGNYRFASVAPGSYTLIATKAGRKLDSKQFSVAASQPSVQAMVAKAAPAGGEDAGDSLVKAIELFYSGKPDDLQQAELMLTGAEFKGKKQGLAEFYLGATRLARYYLAGEGKDQQSMYLDALDAFRQAKRIAGFQPPSDMISPKIQKVYAQAR